MFSLFITLVIAGTFHAVVSLFVVGIAPEEALVCASFFGSVWTTRGASMFVESAVGGVADVTGVGTSLTLSGVFESTRSFGDVLF
jgi:hypothetical protein